jgi:hypothetical protein
VERALGPSKLVSIAANAANAQFLQFGVWQFGRMLARPHEHKLVDDSTSFQLDRG